MPCFAAATSRIGLHALKIPTTTAPTLGASGSGLCSTREGPRKSWSLVLLTGAVVDAASELRLDDAMASAEERRDDMREKLGRRRLPLMQPATLVMPTVLKKSGTMVAISGRRGGMLPVMMQSPVSATDQL